MSFVEGRAAPLFVGHDSLGPSVSIDDMTASHATSGQRIKTPGTAIEVIDWGHLPFHEAHQRQLAALEDRIAGKSGCNQYMGSVTEGEMPGDLTVGLLAGTMMACPPEIMELEDRYRQRLERVFKIGFFIGELALSFEKEDGSGGTLLFAPRQPGE